MISDMDKFKKNTKLLRKDTILILTYFDMLETIKITQGTS